MQCLGSNSRQQSGWQYPSVARSVVPDKFTGPIRTRSLPSWWKGPPWFLPYNPSYGVRKWAFFFSVFSTFSIEDEFRRWWVWLLESWSGHRHEGSHGSRWQSFGWCGSSGVYPFILFPYFCFLNNIVGQQTSKSLYMFQYFIKVVSTQFRTLDGQKVRLHRPFMILKIYFVLIFIIRSTLINIAPQSLNVICRKEQTAILPEAFTYSTVWAVCQVRYICIYILSHRMMTVTFSLSAGTFFNFEISPILVVHAETRQSFAHFLTSLVSPLFIWYTRYWL